MFLQFLQHTDFAKPFSGFETNLEVLNEHDPTSDPNNKLYMSHVDTSSWLDCVAKRSGLPRWLLSITILFSSVALLWLCCATMVTAPERRVKVPVSVIIFNTIRLRFLILDRIHAINFTLHLPSVYRVAQKECNDFDR